MLAAQRNSPSQCYAMLVRPSLWHVCGDNTGRYGIHTVNNVPHAGMLRACEGSELVAALPDWLVASRFQFKTVVHPII